ncbi:hypothetical protein JTE90_006613 [Oedothorax gibbosus]|uniref:Secreted protein n=1 Tax=Oedothorax gibbosus TaxID=931172 RepID=A0AAV6U5Z6_9ARAC|nr:hypothetical protein JTE90_006613 [Oedothorax gibbosus]
MQTTKVFVKKVLLHNSKVAVVFWNVVLGHVCASNRLRPARPMTGPDRRRARNKGIIHATSFGVSYAQAREEGSRRSSIFVFQQRPLVSGVSSALHLPQVIV